MYVYSRTRVSLTSISWDFKEVVSSIPSFEDAKCRRGGSTLTLRWRLDNVVTLLDNEELPRYAILKAKWYAGGGL